MVTKSRKDTNNHSHMSNFLILCSGAIYKFVCATDPPPANSPNKDSRLFGKTEPHKIK